MLVDQKDLLRIEKLGSSKQKDLLTKELKEMLFDFTKQSRKANCNLQYPDNWKDLCRKNK